MSSRPIVKSNQNKFNCAVPRRHEPLKRLRLDNDWETIEWKTGIFYWRILQGSHYFMGSSEQELLQRLYKYWTLLARFSHARRILNFTHSAKTNVNYWVVIEKKIANLGNHPKKKKRSHNWDIFRRVAAYTFFWDYDGSRPLITGQ